MDILPMMLARLGGLPVADCRRHRIAGYYFFQRAQRRERRQGVLGHD
ncbi:hypothetical protein [Halocatena marina]|uniref:Uncharacterized protein n=1 Tax=Halocatena marina TaxID=2934937 RepID=A0ABD5YQA7_9EURY|nr:hypothetical protein [Halocatena marina]